MITKDQILNIVDYDRQAGKLFWRETKGRMKKGKEAGNVTNMGYRIVGINGKKLLTHRLIWLIETGCFPALEIDHINRNRLDNRIVNLREANRELNMRNRSCSKNNKLSTKGVVAHESKFRARIMHLGVLVDLGVFDTMEKAAIAYTAAEKVCEAFYQVGN